MGHREYATPRGRKIDPTFDMNDFRELVDVEMESTDTTSTPVVSPLPIAAHRLMLRKGDRGESVKEMQRGMGGLTADGLRPEERRGGKEFVGRVRFGWRA